MECTKGQHTEYFKGSSHLYSFHKERDIPHANRMFSEHVKMRIRSRTFKNIQQAAIIHIVDRIKTDMCW